MRYLCLFAFFLLVLLSFYLVVLFCPIVWCLFVKLSHCLIIVIPLSHCPVVNVQLSHCPLSPCPVVRSPQFLWHVVPLSHCPVVQLSRCPLSSCPVVQLSRCPLFLWPVVPLARCSFGPLSRFSVVLLSHCHLVLVSVGLFDVAPWWQILWPTDKPLSNEQNWDKFTTKEKFPKEKQFVFAKLKLLILPFFLFLETFHSLDIVIFCYKCSRHAVHLFLWLFSGWCSPWH